MKEYGQGKCKKCGGGMSTSDVTKDKCDNCHITEIREHFKLPTKEEITTLTAEVEQLKKGMEKDCGSCRYAEETNYAFMLKCNQLVAIRRENGTEVTSARTCVQPHGSVLVRQDFSCGFHLTGDTP